MRVLVAPDKFKGTLTAAEATEAIARGWRRTDPAATVTPLPLADGGEGTLDAILAALSGDAFQAVVTGPLGDPVVARYGVVEAVAGPTGVVEMAEASGMTLIPEHRRDPRVATTRGTGELILAAVARGAGHILVCIGGSATNDGGAGMGQALGYRLLDGEGRDLEPGGAALLRLDRIEGSRRRPEIDGLDVVVASDVDNPLTGSRGASAIYGPQKGATPADVDLLDRALRRFAEVIRRDLGVDVERIAGGGAAGGLGAGLVAFLGARLQSGADTVMGAVGFDALLRDADVVVTGEGSFDEQSLQGKAPGAVVDAAARAGIPAIVLCGRSAVAPAGVVVLSLVERYGEEGLTHPAEALERLAGDAARMLAAGARLERTTGAT